MFLNLNKKKTVLLHCVHILLHTPNTELNNFGSNSCLASSTTYAYIRFFVSLSFLRLLSHSRSLAGSTRLRAAVADSAAHDAGPSERAKSPVRLWSPVCFPRHSWAQSWVGLHRETHVEPTVAGLCRWVPERAPCVLLLFAFQRLACLCDCVRFGDWELAWPDTGSRI